MDRGVKRIHKDLDIAKFIKKIKILKCFMKCLVNA
jgi:hypothetical protein